MADLADLADLGGAPAPRGVPVPLQLPYAADPGTMTEWLVNHTTGMDHDAVLATLAGMNVKYSQIADPRKSPEAVVGLLKELAEDVLASEHLACFLTVTTPMETGKATVITVSRLSRFRSGIGQTSRFDGNVYGFLGEVEETQLPPLVKLPDNMSLRQVLAVRELTAPSDGEFDAWYGDGPTDPRVPVHGDELIVEEGGVLGEQRRVKVPYLQYLPTAWAPYFMAPQTPEQAMRTWRALELANVTERHTTITRQVTKWLAAACVRVGRSVPIDPRANCT